MNPLRLSVHVVLSLVFTAIGIWILIAPTAVGFQPAGAPWAQATYNDMIVGGVLVVASLGLLIGQVTSAMRVRLRAARR